MRPEEALSVFETFAALGVVVVSFDRGYGEVVPQGCTCLAWGYRMKPPVGNMIVDRVGVSGSLRFGDKFTHCFVPWEAVTSMRPLWATPPQAQGLRVLTNPTPKRTPSKLGHLRRIK